MLGPSCQASPVGKPWVPACPPARLPPATATAPESLAAHYPLSGVGFWPGHSPGCPAAVQTLKESPVRSKEIATLAGNRAKCSFMGRQSYVQTAHHAKYAMQQLRRLWFWDDRPLGGQSMCLISGRFAKGFEQAWPSWEVTNDPTGASSLLCFQLGVLFRSPIVMSTDQ